LIGGRHDSWRVPVEKHFQIHQTGSHVFQRVDQRTGLGHRQLIKRTAERLIDKALQSPKSQTGGLLRKLPNEVHLSGRCQGRPIVMVLSSTIGGTILLALTIKISHHGKIAVGRIVTGRLGGKRLLPGQLVVDRLAADRVDPSGLASQSQQVALKQGGIQIEIDLARGSYRRVVGLPYLP